MIGQGLFQPFGKMKKDLKFKRMYKRVCEYKKQKSYLLYQINWRLLKSISIKQFNLNHILLFP